MATIKTDAELYAQVTAGIRVNGNREITPPIHKAVEDNIIASKLSIKDGGLVVQQLTGYTTDLTPTDDKHFVPKKYIDDIIGTGLDIVYLRLDGANSPTADIDWNGNGILNLGDSSLVTNEKLYNHSHASVKSSLKLYDSVNTQWGILRSYVIGGGSDDSPDTYAKLYQTPGTTWIKSQNGTGNELTVQYTHSAVTGSTTDGVNIGTWGHGLTGHNFSFDNGSVTYTLSVGTNGIGVNTNGFDAFIKADNLTGTKNFQFLDSSGNLLVDSVLQASTGVYDYDGITVASGTQVNIGACTGIIVDNETDPLNPTYTTVTYAGETNKTVTTLGSGIATYVLLDSTGTIVFQNTFPTSAERKSRIYLSKIGHPSGSITTAGNEPDFILSPIAQLRDLYQAIGFINDGVYPSANGANLNFNISAGNAHRIGGNFVNDKTVPNEIDVPAQTPVSFLYRTQTGVGGGFVTDIDPANYDVAGTVTAIGGSSNQATNQYIYLVPGLGLIVQRGQTVYTTLTDAIQAVGRESFVIYPNLVNNAILIGILSVTKGCTALNDTNTARFFLADKFGQSSGSTSGISTGTFQTIYNNSLVPDVTTTTSLGEVIFKRGSASDTDLVFAIQNGAGSTTSSISGNGLVTGSAFIADGTAGAGYLQLVSQSAPPTAVNGSMILYTDSSTRFSMVRRNVANSADITRTLIFNDATVSYTFPSQNTDTLAGLGSAQSFTAQQTFTLPIKAANGAVGGPSYSFTNSATSGMYWDNASTAVKIAIGGVDRLTIAGGGITCGTSLAVGNFNISLGAVAGTILGTATTQKLGIWGATPIVQPTTSVTAASFTANSGTAINDASTFDGYTLGQVIKALRNIGLLA